MYVFVEALALPKGVSQSWVATDLGSRVASDITRLYADAYIQLSHPILTELQVLRLADVATELSGYSGTLNEWLVDNGNKTLPTTPGTFELTEGMADYMDAFYANYSILPFDASRHPDADLSKDERVDLLLRRKGVDYKSMERNVLAVVNGLFHRTGSTEHGFVVYDGGRSANHSGKNAVGLLNFQRVSTFNCYQIEREWFTKPLPLLEYKDRFYLKLPKSMRGKSLMLVIAGFLIPPGDGFNIVNDDTISVAWNRLSMFSRFRIADRELDLRAHVVLEIAKEEEGDDRRLTEEMLSDEFVIQMCTLPQSFLIAFDEPGISIERELLESMRVPGRWLLHRRPQGLLQVDYGYAPVYTVSAQRNNHYVIQAPPQYHRTELGSTVRRTQLKVQEEAHHGAYEFRIGQGSLLMFSSERVVMKTA